MNNIIVYVDDAAYATQMLQSLRPGGNAGARFAGLWWAVHPA